MANLKLYTLCHTVIDSIASVKFDVKDDQMTRQEPQKIKFICSRNVYASSITDDSASSGDRLLRVLSSICENVLMIEYSVSERFH
jgi:hypothetical protein